MSIKDKMAEEEYELEVRKVKALEKIAISPFEKPISL